MNQPVAPSPASIAPGYIVPALLAWLATAFSLVALWLSFRPGMSLVLPLGWIVLTAASGRGLQRAAEWATPLILVLALLSLARTWTSWGIDRELWFPPSNRWIPWLLVGETVSLGLAAGVGLARSRVASGRLLSGKEWPQPLPVADPGSRSIQAVLVLIGATLAVLRVIRLGTAADPLPLGLFWIAVLLVAARGLERGGWWAVWVVVAMVVVDFCQLWWHWFLPELLHPYYAARVWFLVGELAALASSAGLNLFQRRRDWRRTRARSAESRGLTKYRALLAVGAGCWAILLAGYIKLLGGSNDIAAAVASPSIALMLRFLMVRRLRLGDARLGRVAGCTSLVLFFLICFTPVPYAFLGQYLGSTVPGLLIMALALGASTALLAAGGELPRRLSAELADRGGAEDSQAPAATLPDGLATPTEDGGA